jgi:hypothetical protein
MVLWRPSSGVLQAAADPRGVGTSKVVLNGKVAEPVH